MKHIKLFLLIGFLSVGSFAFATNSNSTEPQKEAVINVEELKNRVLEIQKMDFGSMDRLEKQEIKKELISIKKEMKQKGLDSKVSISVGAIIIILLIIIIIA